MVAELKTAAEVRAHARLVQRRINQRYQPPPEAAPQPVPAAPTPPEPALPPVPMILRPETIAVIEEVARKHGFAVALVLGRKRPKGSKLREARIELIRRLHQERHLSSRIIARIMGRDGSTVRQYLHPGRMDEAIARMRDYIKQRRKSAI